MALLQREAELEELVRLVGMDALATDDRLLLQSAKMVREDFLHQNAFDERDTYTSMQKQVRMLSVILHFGDAAKAAMAEGVGLGEILKLNVLDDIARAKLIQEDELDRFTELEQRITAAIRDLPRY
jgi:V/A-type H+-transporting ATPase subunit A